MTRVKRPSRDMAMMTHIHHEEMPTGMYGPYAITRETSGTAWQPESSMHEGLHSMSGGWTTMVHGWATAVWDNQGGARGDRDFYGGNMLMANTHGPYGPGTLGFRAMASAEPATIGKKGYPLLLQTGETADGRTPFIDRQHPHDLAMELATTYSLSSGTSSLFVYAGLPGEPALGPPVFMHRFSGQSFPDAPIGHHWLDSSHITYGVLTAGLVDGDWKAEASRFRGREPDQDRTDIEEPKLDSHSFRLSYNPRSDVALQASYGRLHSPEQLEPGVDVDRVTVSAIVNVVQRGRFLQHTVAWGRNKSRPGHTLDAFLFESTQRLRDRHTWMTRLEQAEKDELFPPADPRAAEVFTVEKLSVGYRYDAWGPRGPLAVGIGALASLARVPGALEGVYDKHPFAGMVFVSAALR
ncbi:MAG TPA: hypothetical protein VGK89_06075 [Candidatus Eisenbacteria bacterium]|jgi:hypothetical protein